MIRHLHILRDRAALLGRVRDFFSKKNVLEVDCCSLRPRAAIDANIDVISAAVTPNQTAFLHTSPEYAMKRLLSAGSKDIYYLGHVFRQGDIGRFHNPEFTMAEWYRLGFTLHQMIQETADLISLFLPPLPIEYLSYRTAFERYVGIDYSNSSINEMQQIAANHHLLPNSKDWTYSNWIHFLLSHLIEPKLGIDKLTVLLDYPPSEAALACLTEKNGEKVAERFEIYHQGLELANGYHELTNPSELKARFQLENEQRILAKKTPYLLDEEFLASLGPHFPDCCGVSVGIDRLLMLRHKAASIHEVLPFAWEIS